MTIKSPTSSAPFNSLMYVAICPGEIIEYPASIPVVCLNQAGEKIRFNISMISFNTSPENIVEDSIEVAITLNNVLNII